MNEFIDKSVNFYADYLAANNDNALLPTAILSAMDGRLGMLEKKLSALSFNHAVELGIIGSIVAAAFNSSREDMNQLRAQSVKNVKRTNGRIGKHQRSWAALWKTS